jgi:ribonuclease P protein component
MLPYDNRLIKRKEYEKVYKLGKRSFSGSIVLKFLLNNSEKTQIGIAIGVKFSKKAVVRNTVKRRVREILRKNLGKIKDGFDVVVSVRAEKEGQTKIESHKIEKDLKDAFERAGLLKD